jgi:hypothetical protein
MVQFKRLKRRACLLHKFSTMHQDQNAFTFLGGALSDVTKNDGLASAGRQAKQGSALASGKSAAQGVNGLLLVVPKLHTVASAGIML